MNAFTIAYNACGLKAYIFLCEGDFLCEKVKNSMGTFLSKFQAPIPTIIQKCSKSYVKIIFWLKSLPYLLMLQEEYNLM